MRLLWRLQSNPRVLEDKADADVRRLEQLDKAVRRDSHKMHAFARFRMVEEEHGSAEHYVAWFEPEHHILRANAGFFVRRFANMRWSILTPRGTLHWDGEILREGPPARKSDAPDGDPAAPPTQLVLNHLWASAAAMAGAIKSITKERPSRFRTF